MLWKEDMLGSLYFVMERRHVRFTVFCLGNKTGSLYFVMETRHVRFTVFCYGNKTC